MRTCEHQLGPQDGRRVRSAPAIGVKHGHDRQHRLALLDSQRVRQTGGEGVQHRGAVAVEDALGVTRGPRGVAQGRPGILVEQGPLVLLGVSHQEFLVAEQAREG